MELDNKLRFYSTWSESSSILNCVLSFNGGIGDVTIEVEQNKINITGKDFSRVLTFTDISLHPDTCRGLACLSNQEVHFSIKADPCGKKSDADTDEISISPVNKSQITLSQNDLVDKIMLLQNKWFCTTCQQKLLADRCILSKVLPLPSENWSDYADMWFCHKPEGGVPVKNKRFLPKSGECLVGETYLLINSEHVQTGAIKLAKDGSLTCNRCGKQLGVMMEPDGSTKEDVVYKLFLHTVKIQHTPSNTAITQSVVNSDQAELFFSRLLSEQSQLYTSFRFIVESTPTNGYKDKGSPVSTCLIWMLDPDVTVYKSSDDSKPEEPLLKSHIIKVLFKCQLNSSNQQRPTDYVTRSLISMWRKDNTVHGLTLPHPVFLQLVYRLIQNCKNLSHSHRFLNSFHVSYISKDSSTVK